MEKIELTIHSSSQCGGNSAYVVLVQDSISCVTKDKGEFNKGTTLVWTASSLGTCLEKEFDVSNDEISFGTMSTDGNDYCPKTLTITMSNGYVFKKEGMIDWVDNGKNNHLRSAKRTSSKYSIGMARGIPGPDHSSHPRVLAKIHRGPRKYRISFLSN